MRNPFIQFAVLLFALVHDVDIGSDEWASDDSRLVAMYGRQSLVQQNAIDQKWKAFLDPRLEALWGTIYTNEKEMLSFRQLLVN